MEEKIGRKIVFVCEVASSLFESLVISLQKIFLPIFFTKFAFFTTSSEFTNKKNNLLKGVDYSFFIYKLASSAFNAW